MQPFERGFAAVVQEMALWGPRLLLALVLLLAGWLVARLLQSLVTRLAARLGLDQPFARMAADGDMPALPPAGVPSRVLGAAVFWVALLFTAVAVFSALRLDAVALPLQGFLARVAEWLPGLLAAGVLVVLGWLLAIIIRNLVVRVLEGFGVDKQLARIGVLSDAAAKQRRFTTLTGFIVYVLVLLLFILPALDVLGLSILAETMQNVVQTVATALPGILAAIVVMSVATLVAFVVREPITRLVGAAGVDRLGVHIGLDPGRGDRTQTISSVAGHSVFWLILLFAFPAALDKLGLEPIVAPLRDAWSRVVAVLPNFAAALGIGLGAVILAHILAPLVERVLRGVGFDGILGRIGLAKLEGARTGSDHWQPSRLAGAIVAFTIYLLLGQEALRVLGLAYMADLVNRIILYLPNLVVAVAIFAVGLYVANVVAQMTRQATAAMTEVNSDVAGSVAYLAIAVFAAAMAIAQLQIGGELVQRTVLLLLGGICLAAAIALGLGLRPLVEQWAQGRFAGWLKPGEGTKRR